MSSSLSSAANIYDGPVHALYKSVPFYAKASVKLSPSVNTMDIMSDAWGKLGARKGNVAITVDLEPAGEFESAAIALLHPFTTLQRGLPIGVTRSLVASGSINTTSNRLTITGHPYSAADAVTVGTSAVLPSPLATGTLYYVKSIDANTIELYTDSGLSSIIDLTTVGTGSLIITRDNPLDLYLVNLGQKLRLHNAALVGVPDLNCGSQVTPFGSAKFEAFLRSSYAPGTTGSYFSFTDEAWSDTTFDPASILTQPLTIALGSTTPFNDMDLAEAAKVSFALKTRDIASDSHGLRGKTLDDLAVTVSFKPRGINAYQALSKLLLESAKGATRSLGQFNVSGTSFYFRGYDSDLVDGPIECGGNADLLGEFKANILRTITTGAADARYYVGTSAPS